MEKSILFREIAEWLHPSDFYQLLLQLSNDAEENDLITVPYYEHSPVIQRGDAQRGEVTPLKRVLQTCRYWGLEQKDWPDEIGDVLWGKGYWDGVEEIVDQLYPTMYVGNKLYQIVIHGHLRALQYYHEHVRHWDEWTCSLAARHGQLKSLQYAHEHGCPWNEDTCKWAAAYGHLECLRYAHEQDCPWDLWTCITAANCGQLECLQYAHEHGCPWNEYTCWCAAEYGELECLQYAHEQCCPIDRNVCMQVAREVNRENIIHYLLEHFPELNS